jgi:hypothetical protein
MKKELVKKVSGFAMALALTAGLTACGNSVEGGTAVEVPQGQVVKAIVAGAKVVDGSGKVLIASTLADGKFPLTGTGPFTSTGGVYNDMSGAPRTAPTLVAEAGSTNITPLTTLYYYASPADKVKLEALCQSAGVAEDAVSTGTVSTNPSLAALAKLNETIGEALTQLGSSATPAYLQGLATATATNVQKLDAAGASTTVLLAAIGSVTLPTGATPLDNTKITAIGNATTPGAIVPAPPTAGTTGTTGGSTGGTSAK